MRRILGCSYLGFSLFIALSLLFGKGGLMSYRDELDYKARIEANLEHLKEINGALSLELRDVSASPDTIRLAARDYGYYGKNEEVIKIQGAPESKKLYKLGTLLKRTADPGDASPLFHIIGFTAAAVAFAFSLPLLGRRAHDHPHR